MSIKKEGHRHLLCRFFLTSYICYILMLLKSSTMAYYREKQMAKDNIKQVPRVIILFCYILVLFIINRLAFDMGCLLITQRTANVTKTILNQCNTIFAMRSFDKTGKDFLSDYMGREYAEKLSLL